MPAEGTMAVNLAVAEPEPEVPPLRVDRDGVMRVGGTRVTLDLVVSAWQRGKAPEQIAADYDTLHLADIYAVISYYLRHRAEVDAYLEQRRQQAEEIRRQNEKHFPPDGIRERLLARPARRTE
jgi:uncharacterized protein (DUF433 family)